MMKILLIVPRYNFTNEASYRYAFPLGFAYISAVLKRAGYPVNTLNLNHISGEIDDIILKELDKESYGLVCTGNTYLGLLITQKSISVIKKHPSRPKIVLGGAIVTKEPEIMIDILKPDFVVIEEGEETILELISCLEQEKVFTDVKGIGYFDENGKIKINERRAQIENLDGLPFPDLEGLEFAEWVDHQCTNDIFNGMVDFPRPYPILGSRGCAYKCTFCYHFSSRYKMRTVDSMIAELKENVKKYRINTLNLYDDLFSANKARILEFCSKLKGIQNSLPWELKWGCQLAVNVVDKDMINTLKESGCVWISFGFESMHQNVLNSMDKRFITPAMILQAYRLCKEAKINVQANFIFGDIAETKETAAETLDNYRKHFAGQIYLAFVRPYPGSGIYEYCVKNGIIKDKVEFVRNLDILSENYYNFTNMSETEFDELKKTVIRYNVKYSRFVVPRLTEVSKGIYNVETKCPHCKSHQKYNKIRIENRKSFALWLICRNCAMRYYIASYLQKLGTKVYPSLKPFIDFYNRNKINIKKKIFA